MSLTIVDPKVNDAGRFKYRVQCECGTRFLVRPDHFHSGRTKECKACSARRTLANNPNPVFAKRPHSGIGEITLTVWGSIQSGAHSRNINFDLSLDYAWNLFLSQGRKCALSGVEITFSDALKNSNPDYSKYTASLDRIDSSKGYVVGNVQWVHKEINRMKGDLSDREFVLWCREVTATYHGS